MRIAVVGSGISGLLSAYLLHPGHEVTVFEAEERTGGHTCTVDVAAGGRSFAVDTGFIVFNERTYPHFVRLLKTLGVEARPSTMSFSVKCPATGVEFRPSTLNTYFAQRRNLLRPAFYRMLLEIRRLRGDLKALAAHGDPSLTLGEYLDRRGYSAFFRRHFIEPMGAAIWSSPPGALRRFPAAFFARFFVNHGFLELAQPRWLTVAGGSRNYLGPLTRPFRDRIRTGCAVQAVRRTDGGIRLRAGGEELDFEAIVLAVHSDQALSLLCDPSEAERAILGAIPYRENGIALHTDTAILPRRRRAWAAWNYLVPGDEEAGVSVTYDMNILQGLEAPVEFLVSLNLEGRLDPRRVLHRARFAHPVYTAAGLAARGRLEEIQGVRRTYFAGAWCGYGFHEDGVNSALSVCRRFGRELA
ncbi:MAG: FAD-dependent oxidoreductase [Desulfobacterales bacterium]